MLETCSGPALPVLRGMGPDFGRMIGNSFGGSEELGLDPAYEFVVACARYCLDPVRFAAPVYPVGVEPQELLKQAFRQGVVALMYKASKAQPGLLPAPLLNDLRGYYFSMLLMGEKYVKLVKRILKDLHSAGIPVIVFKAWAAFPTVYEGAYGVRPFSDIDLLIAPEHARRADALILAAGFETLPEFWPEHRFRHHLTGATYSKEVSKRETYAIDLHWAIFTRRYHDDRIRLADLFSRANPFDVVGEPVLQMSVEDMILHACGHRSLHHHDHSDLSRYYELAWWIHHAAHPVDWQSVLARCESWKLTIALQGFAPTVEALFPGTFAAEFLQALQSQVPSRSDRKMHDWLVRYAHTPLSMVIPARWTPAAVLDALGLLLETIFPGPRYLEQRYGPTRFLPINYWRRWTDLTRRMPNSPDA